MTPLHGLDDYIEKIRPGWANVGVAVAVVRGSEVVYVRGFGSRQAGGDAPVDADTLFQVGSTTKAFTAAALGILVDEGKIGWDDRLVDRLPGFQLQDPWTTRHVTLRDALAHRTGVSNNSHPFFAPMTSDEAVHQLRHVKPEGAFRDSFIYSNLMYAAAGKVVEAVADLSWAEFVKQRLFAPLAMTRSGASPYDYWDARWVTSTFFGSAPGGPSDMAQARGANVAMPHSLDGEGAATVLSWQSYDNAAAAGSIVSSASEMARWIVPHLNQGRVGGRALLTAETVRTLHATQNLHGRPPQFPSDETSRAYALGWLKGQYRGHTHLSHGGGIIGFPAYVALLPEQEIGIVVLSNGSKAQFHKSIAFWVFDRLLGAAPNDWNQVLTSAAEAVLEETRDRETALSQSRPTTMSSTLPLDQYAGVYEDQGGYPGRITVTPREGGLSLSFTGEGAFCARLEPWRGDLFRVRSNPGVAEVLGPLFATFALDPFGKVRSLSAFETTFRRLR